MSFWGCQGTQGHLAAQKMPNESANSTGLLGIVADFYFPISSIHALEEHVRRQWMVISLSPSKNRCCEIVVSGQKSCFMAPRHLHMSGLCQH